MFCKIFIIFKNCRVGRDGSCHVKAALRDFGPDGKQTPIHSDFNVINRAPLSGGLLARSEQAPTIALDSHATPGRYVLKTVVTDEGDPRGSASLHVQSILTVKPAA